MELNDTLKAQGFAVVSSAAVLAEHSMVRLVAAGRLMRRIERSFMGLA